MYSDIANYDEPSGMPLWTTNNEIPFEITATPTYEDEARIGSMLFLQLYATQNNFNPNGIVPISDKPVYIKIIENKPVIFPTNMSHHTGQGIIEIPEEDFRKFINKNPRTRKIQATLPTNRKYLDMLGLNTVKPFSIEDIISIL